MAKRNWNRTLFPNQQKLMKHFGEDLVLAMKRRGYTKALVSERTGFDPKTVKRVFDGDPSVSIGVYVMVMAVLGLEQNFNDLASNDPLGRKLQDIKLLKGQK